MTEKFDVLIAGGGLAGVCAALASSRLGCRTALVQDRSVLGGCSSSEVRVNIGGAGRFQAWGRESGILDELFMAWRSQTSSSAVSSNIDPTWDLTLYDKVRQEKNLTLFLNTSVRKAVVKEDIIGEVVCEQSGSERSLRLQASLYIDATGDGSLAFEAGAVTRSGRESRDEFNERLAPPEADDHTMGSSLLFHAGDVGHPVEYKPPSWAADFPREEDLPFRVHDDVRQGYWWIEIGNPPFDPVGDNEKIRDELLKQLLGVWDHIKNHGEHGAENLVLDWIGMVPGKRESRRVEGDYMLTENDVKRATLFPDRVTYGGWYMDVHTPGGILASDQPPEPTYGNELEVAEMTLPSKPYSIPFRSLYSKNIKNLMMAGRNLSASHIALGSCRLMGTCAVMGQAAGAAAAVCKEKGAYPRQVYEKYIGDLQQQLLKQDSYIPGIKNQDESDLARGAVVTASSSATLLYLEDDGTVLNPAKEGGINGLNAQRGGKRELDMALAQMLPVSEASIASVSLLLESHLSESVELTLGLRPAEDVWDYDKKEDICRAEASAPPNSTGWVSFALNQAVDPHRFYWIYLEPARGVFWHCSARPPMGTTSARIMLDEWKRDKIAYAFRLDPPSKPYEAENIVSGVTRPESWTNAWISDPEASFPQQIELDFRSEVTISMVHLVFDTDLNTVYKHIPPFYRHPACVRDYELLANHKGKWDSLLRVENNCERRRVHRLAPTNADKLKLVIHGTNGAPSAHVFEIRVYDEQTDDRA